MKKLTKKNTFVKLHGKNTEMSHDCILKQINGYKFDYIIKDPKDDVLIHSSVRANNSVI